MKYLCFVQNMNINNSVNRCLMCKYKQFMSVFVFCFWRCINLYLPSMSYHLSMRLTSYPVDPTLLRSLHSEIQEQNNDMVIMKYKWRVTILPQSILVSNKRLMDNSTSNTLYWQTVTHSNRLYLHWKRWNSICWRQDFLSNTHWFW